MVKFTYFTNGIKDEYRNAIIKSVGEEIIYKKHIMLSMLVIWAMGKIF